ncbi:MAG: NADH-quinone oxidoreductase subunit C [Thermoanaerobacterales bacterium]|nr:NADH-quinone oxidoreductase subunit C [Bacillota bacterium]MDI6907361.1 NADH-quinone oxidoreductase subunit C [Thermoanaerobacterales bacterium]
MQSTPTDKQELLTVAEKLAGEGARLAAATCLDAGDRFEVIYHFQKDHETLNVRVMISKDEELPSISGIMLPAALIENEMSEFFGLKIVGKAIDFQGRMLLAEESPQTPLLKS